MFYAESETTQMFCRSNILQFKNDFVICPIVAV